MKRTILFLVLMTLSALLSGCAYFQGGDSGAAGSGWGTGGTTGVSTGADANSDASITGSGFAPR